jgi:hypothetical protein
MHPLTLARSCDSLQRGHVVSSVSTPAVESGLVGEEEVGPGVTAGLVDLEFEESVIIGPAGRPPREAGQRQ